VITPCDTLLNVKDALGVEIEIGDLVKVTARGWGAPQIGTAVAKVLKVNKTRIVIEPTTATYCGQPSVRSECVQVLRRDGTTGWEGNRLLSQE
jgi:NAD-dependent DNA ligase